MKKNDNLDLPSIDQLNAELKRVNFSSRFRKLLRSTIYTLIVVSAIAVLIAVLFMPVMRIYGNAMTPTLNEGEIVVSIKSNNINCGDIVGLYCESKLLVKRCIAREGESVCIDEDGNVYVNNVLLDEPYVAQKALGECNLEFPYEVPAGCIFVIGDNREVSVDSRNTIVGSIDKENIVGKVIFRVWPFESFGSLIAGHR